MSKTIGQVCSRFSSGKSIKSEQINSTGLYPVYGGNGLRGYTDTYNFDGECVIIGRQGAYCGNVRYYSGKAYMTEHAIVACANADNCTAFLSYKLSSMNLSQYQGQSAQPGLSVTTLSKVPITLPDYDTQCRIAKTLSTIDAKISNNNRINAELESMAKTIYDYWFTQFDFPDENGKPYKSSGGKMVWNEELKREIPEGWEVGTLSDISDITMGSSPKGESLNENKEGIIFYQGKTDFGDRFPTERVYTTSPIRYAEENDVLLSVRAPVGSINIANEKCCIGRGLASIHSKYQSFVFYLLLANQFQFDKFNQAGTTFGAATKDDVFGLKCIIPNDSIMLAFEKAVQTLDNKIRNNAKENQQLASLRDWLLPMLMNGQVGFKEGT